MLTRRRFITTATGSALSMLAASRTTTSAAPAASARPNVLMIAVDDLNDWIAPLGGHPQVRTPHLDRLAQRGVVFANASCPAPICTPARTAVLTGIHPASSGLYFLQPLFRRTPTLAHAVTLPQCLRQHGYRTMAVGKVFHGENDPASLDEDGGIVNNYGPTPPQKISLPDGHPLWDWGAFPLDDSPTPDDRITDWAVKRLGRHYDQPFFLGVGLFRPHVPMYAPQRWFDLYPAGKTTMPDAAPVSGAGVSDYARQLTHARVAPRHDQIVALGQWEHAVRAYLASVSYMDDHVGRLLDALEAGPHADNTLIVFWSDHGFHLGEKQRWEKRSLWEESCRVPLIVAGPGIAPGRTESPVGTLDLYPTLTALCRVPCPEGLDGHDLTPLLADPDAHWPHATVTTFGPGNHAVRSRHHRYIRYADGSEELYDHRTDPHETRNLADEPDAPAVIASLRPALPTRNAPLVPDSAGSDSPLFP
mgnify:CR=1 FL=1